MNRSAMRTFGLRLALISALICSATVAIAAPDGEDCVQACGDQWTAAKDACQAALDARLAELDQQAADCITNNPNPLNAALCVRQVNVRRFNARQDYQRCVNRANTTAFNCYRNCSASESAPTGRGSKRR